MNIKTAQRLYELRKKNGYSQEELADKLGISRQAVSKWERAESSPDTDNLIELAKLYGVTLDELLNGEDAYDTIQENKDNKFGDDTNGNKESTDDSTKSNNKTKNEENEPRDRVIINDDGIYISDDEGSKVILNEDGIILKDGNGNKVVIGDDGIHVEDGEPMGERDKKFKLINNIVSAIWVTLIAVAYVLLGCFASGNNGWRLYWFVFILIPVAPSIVDAIHKKKATDFAFFAVVVATYCAVGMLKDLWHPLWILFISIPVYYVIASSIEKLVNKNSDLDDNETNIAKDTESDTDEDKERTETTTL